MWDRHPFQDTVCSLRGERLPWLLSITLISGSLDSGFNGNYKALCCRCSRHRRLPLAMLFICMLFTVMICGSARNLADVVVYRPRQSRGSLKRYPLEQEQVGDPSQRQMWYVRPMAWELLCFSLISFVILLSHTHPASSTGPAYTLKLMLYALTLARTI